MGASKDAAASIDGGGQTELEGLGSEALEARTGQLKAQLSGVTALEGKLKTTRGAGHPGAASMAQQRDGDPEVAGTVGAIECRLTEFDCKMRELQETEEVMTKRETMRCNLGCKRVDDASDVAQSQLLQ
ncbi:unnamed protein product [Prorocentrum cordatum]|uniref:Uncharacterized protein n=1 Tax=Prorocentrum cordatum TaxID=2364126 RepID=A0ABN9Q1E1_9DINO|nr:unnamed protein product [Polarella glacialis]